MKSEAEHKFTSTGIKFWRHPKQMNAYRDGKSHTVISTHVSPEGTCNLKCPYCSVTYRKVSNRIELQVIQRYVKILKGYGLKCVILTGGGEPTIYPKFSRLVEWLRYQGLQVALITNGTQLHRVEDWIWKEFSWVRVSINMFQGWRDKIHFPVLSADAVLGSSFVFTQRHEQINNIDVSLLREIGQFVRDGGGQYLRILPNCLLPQKDLKHSHDLLETLLKHVDDDIIFHQHKLHRVPNSVICHQSYFRPYLSEIPFKGTNIPGSVFPCDSIVLNDGVAQFVEKYQLCAPGDIDQYLDGKIGQQFDPRKDCRGCVFTDTVEMLGEWQETGKGKFDQYLDPIKHEDFV